MSEYKLVPVEPTPEMEQAAEKYWNERKFKALSDDPRTWKGLYAAMLADAPAVQGEAPAEQQPDVAQLVEIAKEIVDLHDKRRVVLTVHVEALREALAAHRNKGGEA